MRNKYIIIIRKYLFVVGFLLFFLVLNKVNPSKLWPIIQKIDMRLFIVALLFNPALLLIKSLCWNYLKQVQDIKYKLFDSLLMFSAGMGIGCLTPGRLGEVSKVVYLKKDGHSLGKSIATVIIDRLSDLIALAVLTYIGVVILFGLWNKTTLYCAACIPCCVGLFILAKRNILQRFINYGFNFVIPVRFREKWRIGFADFARGLKAYTRKDYIVIFLITFVSWCVFYVQIYMFSQSIGLNIPFLHLSVAATLSGFASILPISFLGIGIRDATLLGLLSPLTTNTEGIIILSQLILVDLVVLGLIGGIALLFKPMPLSQK